MAQPSGLIGTSREWSRDLAIAASAGLFLGLVGPFGTYLSPSRILVLAYWVGALLLGTVLYGLTLRPAVRLAPRMGVSATALLVVMLVVVAIPLALVCHAVAARLWPGPVSRIGQGVWYAQTLVISLPLALCYRVQLGVLPARPPDPAPEPEFLASDAPVNQDFMRRLPPRVGQTLLALEMEDHYVRAHTAAGSALILIPLHRAIAELGAVNGIQTHRSWWVARNAVTGVMRDGRNLRLQLANGIQAPVARTKIASLRAAGLI